jgi:hypothetical protein
MVLVERTVNMAPTIRGLALLWCVATASAQEAASRPSDYRVLAAGPAGAIRARVRYAGDAPATRPLVLADGFRRRAPTDAAFCDECARKGEFVDESLLVDPRSKGVRDVAVALRKLDAGRRPHLPVATLDNRGARFAPRVLFAPVGEPLKLKNSDPIEHATALSAYGGALLCNLALPAGATQSSPRLLEPGIYVVTCPLHDWMRSTVIAVRHPYAAATDKDGVASLDLVPPGTHTVTFWHETLGTASRKVDVRADATVEIELLSTDFKAAR